MGLTAQFREFGPFFHNGQLVAAPRIYHWLPGTTTLKDSWYERTKQNTQPNPIIGDANGMVTGYFDGLYKIEVRKSDDSTVVTTNDNVLLAEPMTRLAGTIIWDPGSLADGAGETSPPIMVEGAAFLDHAIASAPYDVQGCTCTAYVSAANTVKIRIQNETGNVVNLANGQWTVTVFTGL